MILFLDIDGVLLPSKAYFLPKQTKGIVKTFDPCIVSLVNRLCEKTGAKIVIHSSWLRTVLNMVSDVRSHMIKQGIRAKHFHKDHSVRWRFSGSRWLAISEWLEKHPEVEGDYWIFDDEDLPTNPGDLNAIHNLRADRFLQTDFDDGIQLTHIEKIMNLNDFFINEKEIK